MAYSEIEIQRIKNSVGEMCRRRSPVQYKDQLEYIFEINGQSVSIYEIRPRWDNPREKTKLGVARFKYIRSQKQWRLYWMSRDLKWHLYDPDEMPKTLEALVRVVDKDQHGAFFG
jgi:hypothetical protein